MTASQRKIHEFPEGNELWLIKWIDEFRLPHLGTRSASVSVVLQQLAARDFTELDDLAADQLSPILGKKRQQDAPALRTERVMIGTLPLLEIGQIYQNQIKVGQLPTSMATLSLQDDSEVEVTLGQEMPKPLGWSPDYPYRMLNAFEYYGIWRMDKSRCLVISRQRRTSVTEYIIPRTTIFKAFYGQHTEIAKAFCKGPWSEKFEDVICLMDFESGIKTQIADGGRKWHIVLETLVPDAFAPALALLYFDDYARTCAESIYTRSLQDREGKTNAPWYASAKIPHRSVNEPFRMWTKCLPLAPWKWTDKAGDKHEIKKFLVTSIVGSSWPSHLPIIGRSRRNSGDKGATIVREDGPAPYIKVSEGETNTPDVTIDGTQDASQDSPNRALPSDDWIWLNEPAVEKLIKDSSKVYDGDRPIKPISGGDRISTGEHTREQGGHVKGEATVLVRAPEKRFEQIFIILTQLKTEGIVGSLREVPSPNDWQQVTRGGRSCWSFVEEEAAKLGRKPKRGWRLVEHDSNNAKKSIYRCALVLEITIGANKHYWIEIECRKKDQGFRSAFLSNLSSNYREFLEIAIETIALAKGLNIDKELKRLLSGQNVQVDSYKHHYVSQSHSNLDINSVRRFLLGR